MHNRPRPTLSRAERQAGIARRLELRREAMSPADVEALMRKTMHSALDAAGCVSRDDLIRANVPPEPIDRLFGPLLKAVIQERKKAGIRA